MAGDKKTLVLELRQIIQADRQAADIIRRAKDTRRQIEADAEKQKAAILADAEKKRDEMIEQVKAEQAGQLAERKKQAQKAAKARRKKLDGEMEKHRAAWTEEIYRRITAP